MKNLEINLPLDSIEVLDGELELVYGGFVPIPEGTNGGADCGCFCNNGAGCGCDFGRGCGCGCECSSGVGCGCNCTSGGGCMCVQKTTEPPKP